MDRCFGATLTDTDGEPGDDDPRGHVLEDVGAAGADEGRRLSVVGVVVGGAFEA